jgi:phospho-N-acetylmuramoyl-pentapeptide-transferase
MLNIESLTHDILAVSLITLLTFFVAMLITPIYTYFAYKHKLWKQPRTKATTGEALEVIPKLRIKRTIPRMAGLIIIVAVTLVTVLFNLDRTQTWLPLAAFLGAGVIGLIDDFINIKGMGGGVAGLSASLKLLLITLVGGIGAWWFYFKLNIAAVQIPFYGETELGVLIIPLFVLVLVSTSNAVNITDGVDGLAGGLLVSGFGAFGVIALLQGNIGIAGFCLAIVGALLAYLWFNIAPARFVMGDVGSFALGTALGVVAMITNTLLLLPIVGLVFVAEAGSTLLQILSKKIRKRKIFIAAPLHHHLEAKGWTKEKVTMRFWVIGQVCAVIGFIVAFTGGYI